MGESGVSLEAAEAALAELDAKGETPIIVAVDGQVAGLIGARDTVRPEAHDVIHDLKHLRITEIAILTGDRTSAARSVAKRVHIKNVEAELLPADKAAWIEGRQKAGRRVAMVGDGINDAPALARANVGIALGGIGADLAAEAGDLVVLGDPLRVLPDLLKLSRATVAVIRQNILIFAFGLNAVAMGSAALGILGPIPAAILHQAGSLLVLLNAMRLLAFGDWGTLPPFRWLRSVGRAIHRLDDRLDPGLTFDRILARWRPLVGLAILAALTGHVSHLGLDGDRPGRGGDAPAVRPVRRRARAGPAPPAPAADRAGHEARAGAGPERRGRLPLRGARDKSGAVGWESSHERGNAARADDEALLITGDGQLVEVAATAEYRLDESKPDALRAYAFGISRADRALRPLAESVIRSVIGRRRLLDDLLTRARLDAEEAPRRPCKGGWTPRARPA